MKKVLRDFVNLRCGRLKDSAEDFRSVYDIIFSDGDLILAETYEDYRIRKYPYGEVRSLIERAAAGLYAKIGATHKYVALEMENGLPWVVAFWAILKSGNKPYLVNCRHPKSLSEGILSTLEIKYVIGLNSSELGRSFIEYNELFTAGGRLPEDEFENEMALSTSATSLNEVICFYSGAEVSEQILCAHNILERSDRVSIHYKNSLKLLAFLPFYHVFGLFAVLLWFTFFGRTLVFLNDYSGETILSTCRRHEVTHIFAVPMLWHTIENELRRKLDGYPEKKKKKFEKGIRFCTALQNVSPVLGSRIAMRIMREVTDRLFGRSVRFCISGGSYLRSSALELFNALGYSLHNGYGMTEAGITSVELRDKPKHKNLNSVGKPLIAVEYRVAEDGTLYIKGKTLCRAIMINGVIQDKEEWFDTGDLVYEKDGYYYVKGRKSDVVIGESGENLDPDLIEQMFDLPQAARFSVVGLKDDGENDSLSFVLQAKKDQDREQVSEICGRILEINKTLPLTYRVKRFYVTRDDIASESAIKVGRAYLKRGVSDGSIRLVPFERLSALDESADGIDADIADKVRRIICEVLGIEPDRLSDNADIMLECGATSLQYFSILAKLAEEFGEVDYSDRSVYCTSVNDFSRYISERLKSR